jgi:hypothetical protein
MKIVSHHAMEIALPYLLHAAPTKEEPGKPEDKAATLEGPFLAAFQVGSYNEVEGQVS